MSYRTFARSVPTVWIAVADRSAARFFLADWPTLDHFREIADLVNPRGTLQGREIYSDRFGRNHSPDGHSYVDVPSTDLRHYTAETFAIKIVRHLEDGRAHNQFGKLIVIAPPLMLGAIREQYSAPLQKLIELEIDKELIHAPGIDVLQQVRTALDSRAVVLQ